MSPEIPQTETFEAEGRALVATVRALTISSHEDYERAGAQLVDIARKKRAIEDAFAGPKKSAFDTHKKITMLETDRPVVGCNGEQLPREAERVLKSAMSTFAEAERRIRAEREREIDAELRRQAEDDVLAEAEALAGQGESVAAEALLERPVVAPVVQLARPKAAGISERKRFVFEIVDASKIDRKFLTPDLVKIRQTVTALGPDAAGHIGGIVVREEVSVAVRARS